MYVYIYILYGARPGWTQNRLGYPGYDLLCGYPWQWQGAGAVPVMAVGASFRLWGNHCIGVQKIQSAGCAGLRHSLHERRCS